MPVSTLANLSEQQGAFSFDLTCAKNGNQYTSWRSKGSAMEAWVENLGTEDCELSFDGGSSWKTLVAGGVDVYRINMIGFHYRRKSGGSASNTLNCLILTGNSNPKPSLAVGQKDDGKVR